MVERLSAEKHPIIDKIRRFREKRDIHVVPLYKYDGEILDPQDPLVSLIAQFREWIPPHVQITMQRSAQQRWEVREMVDVQGSPLDSDSAVEYLAQQKGYVSGSTILFENGVPTIEIKPLHGNFPE